MTNGSSKTSSVAGSLFGRSQLNSILHYNGNSIHDVSMTGGSLSVGPSESATVLLAENSAQHRGKSVAFDINRCSRPSTNTPSPNVHPKSILHRQNGPSVKKPTTLSFTDVQPEARRPAKKIDFIHDDWYGMAPLASPETLSEISSISSRTSLVMNLASSIDKYLHRITSIGGNGGNHKVLMNPSAPNDSDEQSDTQMITPKVMRRTPKVSGNLSTCADDWKTVDSYKRMGKVFITSPSGGEWRGAEESEEEWRRVEGKYIVEPPISDSSADSLESSFGLTATKMGDVGEGSRSADNLDSNDVLRAGFGHSSKLAMSDSAILNDIPSPTNRPNANVPTHTSSSDTYHSAISSLNALETIQVSPKQTKSSDDHLNGTNPQIGVLESHFPVHASSGSAKTTEKSSLIPTSKRMKQVKMMSKKSGAVLPTNKNRIGDNGDDRAFSRNESLPLLANLNERSSPSSFVKRKKCVYPVESSPRPSPSKKTESSV